MTDNGCDMKMTVQTQHGHAEVEVLRDFGVTCVTRATRGDFEAGRPKYVVTHVATGLSIWRTGSLRAARSVACTLSTDQGFIDLQTDAVDPLGSGRSAWKSLSLYTALKAVRDAAVQKAGWKT